MRFRIPPWLVLFLLVGLCASLVGIVAHLRSERHSMQDLVERLPSENAVVLYVDFAALRQSGVLDLFSGSDLVQEPEYRVFVEQSGFDYLRDLDTAVAAFDPTGTYFVLRGRFDWKALNAYVTRQGGRCNNTFCREAGSTPDRKISFFPLRPSVMALAVSPDDSAASAMMKRRSQHAGALPPAPLWVLIPAGSLKKTEERFPGMRLFARALEGAETILLSAAPQGDRLELEMRARCPSPREAAALVDRLQKTTEVVRDLIARENKQPNPSDISGVLTAGAFRQDGRTVFGRWPIPRTFLETLAGGRP